MKTDLSHLRTLAEKAKAWLNEGHPMTWTRHTNLWHGADADGEAALLIAALSPDTVGVQGLSVRSRGPAVAGRECRRGGFFWPRRLTN